MSRSSVLILLMITFNKLVYSKRIEDIPICLNDTECDEFYETENYDEMYNKDKAVINESSDTTAIIPEIITSSINHSTETRKFYTKELLTKIYPFITNKSDKESKNITIQRRKSEICECDLTVASCDINCCCDSDCKESQLSAFSHCEEHHTDLYDSRYCYHRNFIERNNTPFILEKLTNNLFCILYDNLPPMYTINNDLVVSSLKDLKAAIPSKEPKWKLETMQNVRGYNITDNYREGEFVWKLEKNDIKPLELPQTGFTGLCSFKKSVKYLQRWKDSCMQVDLSKRNIYLFPATFHNFTVIKSLYLFNKTYNILVDEVIRLNEKNCPKNVCLTPISYYCHNSWDNCSKNESSSICLDGVCRNIVKGVKYLIIHNGSFGIDSVNIYFKIGNVSHNFYQHFEVIYEWNNVSAKVILSRSGNPGYIWGKPIIIGTLKKNKTNNVESRYISFNKANNLLTLPLGEKSGECSRTDRYAITFGENIKLKCSVSVKTTNFTTTSCIELQNKTLHLLMQESLFNVTQSDHYTTYISKSGNFTNNDTSEWVQILLDRIPHNIISGSISNGQIQCSGLVTSLQLDILYSKLTKPKTLANHNILGVGLTFSEELDISWIKCNIRNCTDTLKVDVISYVMFHDVSKPSKFYFAGGPNLDITLPYDFFYPFLNGATCVKSSIIMLSGIIYSIYITIA